MNWASRESPNRQILPKSNNFPLLNPTSPKNPCSICQTAPTMWPPATSCGCNKNNRKYHVCEESNSNKSTENRNAATLPRFEIIKENTKSNFPDSARKEWCTTFKGSRWWRRTQQPICEKKRDTVRRTSPTYPINRTQTSIFHEKGLPHCHRHQQQSKRSKHTSRQSARSTTKYWNWKYDLCPYTFLSPSLPLLNICCA